ncbi:MAG: thiol-disulfide oxidoreductase DCC family protein [Sediminibacterium sp.]
MQKMIFFDGVCNFCNQTVKIILAHDQKAQFQFAPNQSNFAKDRMRQLGVASNVLHSVVLIEEDKVYTKTDAVIQISASLSGWPRFFRMLKFIPKPIRDFFYDSFAKYRYRLFGKRSFCMIPDIKYKNRFLE